MFSTIFKRQNVLALLVVTCSGCAGLDSCHQAPTEVKILGTVRTGGPLARATTLPIHLHGLTLSDVVESTIRPGLLGGGNSDYVPSRLPVSGQQLTLDDQVKNLMNRSEGYIDANDFMVQLKAVGDPSQLGVNPDLTNKIFERVEAALESSALKSKKTGDPGQIGGGIDELPDFTPDQLGERGELEKLLIEALRPVIDDFNDAQKERSEIHRTESGITGGSDLVAVRLSRKDGGRLIFPLPMIRNYSPGDIWMMDGDVVQIMPWGTTEAGQQLPSLSSTPVSSILSNVEEGNDAGLNLIILVHKSILDGRPEEYYLPARNTSYYGSTTFVRLWQDASYHHEGDALRAGSLELNSLIRKSQLNTVAASAAELEEELNPKVESFGDKCKRKFTQCSRTVEQVPVVGGVFSQVNNRIGPMLQRDPLQESTGFDREEFCRSLTP